MKKNMCFFIMIILLTFASNNCDKISDTGWKELKNCPEQPYVDYMGKRYETVKIGDQCWFAQNLDAGVQISNTEVADAENDIIEKYCYDNQPGNCNIYGALYSWEEAMQYNKATQKNDICPIGWYVANSNDWEILAEYLGHNAGKKMKQAGDSHWKIVSSYSRGDNSSGFSALPAGYLNSVNSFHELKTSAFFWSRDRSKAIVLKHNDHRISNEYSGIKAASVRCIKSNQPPEILWLTDDEINNFPLDGKIQWEARDPNQNPISFNFYLGVKSSGSIPPLLFEGLRESEANLSGKLLPGALYHWKLEVADGITFVESDIRTFVTEPPGCPDIEKIYYAGRVYHTVQVGNQCWMRESLDVGKMIPWHSPSMNNGIIEKYCIDDDPENCLKYGALYLWPEMMNYEIEEGAQGICPPGWYVPTNQDWAELASFLGDGGKLKSIGTQYWASPNKGANNESGMSFLPNSENNTYVTVWSSTSSYFYDGTWRTRHYRQLYSGGTSFHSFENGWLWGSYRNTVRCIKDDN